MLRPFKINCLFCISARVAFAMIKTETQTVNFSCVCFVFRSRAYKLEFFFMQNRQFILNSLNGKAEESNEIQCLITSVLSIICTKEINTKGVYLKGTYWLKSHTFCRTIQPVYLPWGMKLQSYLGIPGNCIVVTEPTNFFPNTESCNLLKAKHILWDPEGMEGYPSGLATLDK